MNTTVKQSLLLTLFFICLASTVILFALFRLNVSHDTAFFAGPAGAPVPLKETSIFFWDHLQIWDAHFFKDVAEHGYSAKTAAFFPFYPALTRIMAALTQDYFLGAGVLSGIGIFFSLYYFQKFSALHLPAERVRDATLLFLFFPTSFFLLAPYTESIFVPLLLAFLYYTEKKYWWHAALAGCALALTRVPGVLAAIVPFAANFSQRKIKVNKESFIAIAAPIVALAAFCIYLFVSFGNAFQFIDAQKHWRRNISFTADSIISRFALDVQDFTSAPSWFHPKSLMYLTDAAFFIGSVILIIFLFLRWRKEYAIFSLGILAVPVLTGTLYSMPRFVLPLAPLFAILLTRQVHDHATRQYLLLISCTVWVILLTLFVNFSWVA